MGRLADRPASSTLAAEHGPGRRDCRRPARFPANLERQMRARMVSPSFPHHDPVRALLVPEMVDLGDEATG